MRSLPVKKNHNGLAVSEILQYRPTDIDPVTLFYDFIYTNRGLQWGEREHNDPPFFILVLINYQTIHISIDISITYDLQSIYINVAINIFIEYIHQSFKNVSINLSTYQLPHTGGTL